MTANEKTNDVPLRDWKERGGTLFLCLKDCYSINFDIFFHYGG